MLLGNSVLGSQLNSTSALATSFFSVCLSIYRPIPSPCLWHSTPSVSHHPAAMQPLISKPIRIVVVVVLIAVVAGRNPNCPIHYRVSSMRSRLRHSLSPSRAPLAPPPIFKVGVVSVLSAPPSVLCSPLLSNTNGTGYDTIRDSRTQPIDFLCFGVGRSVGRCGHLSCGCSLSLESRSRCATTTSVCVCEQPALLLSDARTTAVDQLKEHKQN